MKTFDFESNLKSLRGTFAVENLEVSKEGIENLKMINSGVVSYKDVIKGLKQKYSQKV